MSRPPYDYIAKKGGGIYGVWRKWFAWYPVMTEEGKLVWLRKIWKCPLWWTDGNSYAITPPVSDYPIYNG